ncbi:MAG: hypothetical protein JKY94_00635 [Rhodobacteraceae bacterium]|nr:hypothetical protein [Paracoccaceae bacterium]
MKICSKLVLVILPLAVSVNAYSLDEKAYNLDKKDVKKICLGAKLNTDDVRGNYLDYIYKTHTVPLDFLYSHGGLSELLVYCRGHSSTVVKNCAPIKKMDNEIRGLIAGGTVGPHSALRVSETLENPPVAEIASFLSKSKTKYKLFCAKPYLGYAKPEAPAALKPGLSFHWNTISVTKDNSTIGKKIDKKESAEFGIKFDRGAKTKVKDANGVETLEYEDFVSANFTLALTDFIKFTPRAGANPARAPGPSLTPFLSLAYESNREIEKEKDDFSIGVVWKQYFSNRHYRDDGGENTDDRKFRFELDHFLLNGQYITDIEERQSQQWASQLTLPFASYDGSSFNAYGAYFTWYLAADLILDHSEISRAGDKVDLIKFLKDNENEKGAKSFTRFGYDVRFNSALKVDEKWSLELDAKYQLRNATRTGGLGDVNRWEIGLGYRPNDDSPVSFGISYERGDTLLTLKEEEFWKVGIKYKQ